MSLSLLELCLGQLQGWPHPAPLCGVSRRRFGFSPESISTGSPGKGPSLAPCSPLKSTLGSIQNDDEGGTWSCPAALQRFGVEHLPAPVEDLGVPQYCHGGLQGTLVPTMFAGGPELAAAGWPQALGSFPSEFCGCSALKLCSVSRVW